jgi:hypothetical protein
VTLLDRLGATKELDRELDADIAVAVFGGVIVWKQAQGTMDQYPVRRYPSQNHVGGFGFAAVERFTESLDSALVLVPAKFCWRVGHSGDSFRAEVWAEAGVVATGIEVSYGISPSPAVAICIAALAAIARIENQKATIAADAKRWRQQAEEKQRLRDQ